MNDKMTFECSSCQKEPTGRINVSRMIARLDRAFSAGNPEEAGNTLSYWEAEARNCGDDRGLLSVLNEVIGFSRRTGDRVRGLSAVDEALALLDSTGVGSTFSGATVYINAATTLKAFGEAERGLPLYDLAERLYRAVGRNETYEFAALLNNRAAALCDLSRFDEAEKCYRDAIALLEKEGKHDGEIAVSLINLAHLYYDRDENAIDEVEELLDRSWEYLNSPRQPHDGNYAFILSKCAPSLRYFGREIEADAAEEVSREIYGGNR